MTNVELAEKVGNYLSGSKDKAEKFQDLIAVNFTLNDEDGDMYIEVKNGALSVAPYHYNDYNVDVTGSSEVICSVFSGEQDMETALNDGMLRINDGDPAKFKALAVLIPAREEKAEAPEEPAPIAEEKEPEPVKDPESVQPDFVKEQEPEPIKQPVPEPKTQTVQVRPVNGNNNNKNKFPGKNSGKKKKKK